jgi:hypothetical protein
VFESVSTCVVLRSNRPVLVSYCVVSCCSDKFPYDPSCSLTATEPRHAFVMGPTSYAFVMGPTSSGVVVSGRVYGWLFSDQYVPVFYAYCGSGDTL